MENESVLYFDGISARPAQVRVMISNDEVFLYAEEGYHFIRSFPLAGTSHNHVGAAHYLYLDPKGLMYLQLADDHPVATGLSKQVEDANPHWEHRLMKQKTLVLVPLLVVLVIGLYFLLINLVPFLGSRMISVEQEIVMGDRLKDVVLQEAFALGAEEDTAGTRQLQAFADKLKLSSQYPIRMTLLKDKMVNAFALPGGNVVVYSGILEEIDTPEALAALLAHESTHVNERHSLRSLLRSAANGILLSVVFNDATGISGALVSNAEALNGLRYSRSLEAEADKKGMELLVANGMDAKGMRQLMQALSKKETHLPGNLSFLSTHPLTKERIKAADHFIQEHPKKTTPREDLGKIFEALKKK